MEVHSECAVHEEVLKSGSQDCNTCHLLYDTDLHLASSRLGIYLLNCGSLSCNLCGVLTHLRLSYFTPKFNSSVIFDMKHPRKHEIF